jgi:hypothetical protein
MSIKHFCDRCKEEIKDQPVKDMVILDKKTYYIGLEIKPMIFSRHTGKRPRNIQDKSEEESTKRIPDVCKKCIKEILIKEVDNIVMIGGNHVGSTS